MKLFFHGYDMEIIWIFEAYHELAKKFAKMRYLVAVKFNFFNPIVHGLFQGAVPHGV